MRKSIIVCILAMMATMSYALHVECVGNATLLTNDGDTLLVFEKEPLMRIKGMEGAVTVYQYPDSNTIAFETSDVAIANEFYPEHGEGYMLKQGDLREVFWVFDYDSLRLDVAAVNAELTCENSVLRLEGEVPMIEYRQLYGRKEQYPRMATVTYTDMKWDGSVNEWLDSVAVEEVELKETIYVGSTLATTDFCISDKLARLLQLSEDSLYSEVYAPVAVDAHPQAIVTIRGKEGDLSNEVDRPVDAETILQRSAPMTVNFKVNAVNATHYQWVLYKGSDKRLQRNEAQHQYVFEEPGSYRMVVGITNGQCTMDSVEFVISVSESMLKVPNVFTPNGDGTNDEFRVVYRSLKEFHCWIYNRWGHLVYEWTDPAKGWDGTINGKPAAEGAYYYVIRALGTDAESDYMMKPVYTKKMKKQELPMGVYQLSGDINLIRGGKR